MTRIVVAIPAKDEAELLPQCLTALGRQTGVEPGDFAVVVSCNNTTDGTPDIIRALDLPFALHVEEVTLAPGIAHAGGARRHAMDAAAARCAGDGVILTTDADGVPDAGWVAAMARAFVPGIAAVAGRVSTNWDQLSQFPADVLAIGAREWEYQLLSAELDARVDPEALDPWPRHNQTCGANMAISRDWYGRIGGLPVIRTGEDGAMFAEVRKRDGGVRHDMASHVTVSARLVGRAQGGMADALTMRHGDAYLCDDLLEPAGDLFRRARLRHAARAAFGQGRLAGWAASAGLPPPAATETFGAAWAAWEAGVPALAKRRIAASGIDAELTRIKALLADGQALTASAAA